MSLNLKSGILNCFVFNENIPIENVHLHVMRLKLLSINLIYIKS